MRRLALLALLLIAPAAAAQTAPVDWQGQYLDVESTVLRGDFAQAIPALETLLTQAADAESLARARLLLKLCKSWVASGAGLRLSREAPRVQSIRTTGEIARLYIDGVTYGLATGIFVAVHSDPKSVTGVVLPTLLSGGLVGGAIAFADSNDLFGYGLPRAISAGLRIGLMEGIAWMGWYQAQANSNGELTDEGIANLLWGSATAGAVIGGVLGAQLDLTPGHAAFVESGALWSAGVVGLTAGALVGDDDQADDAFMLSSALALNVGAGLAAWLASDLNPSSDRATFLDLGGIAGGLVGGGLYLVFADTAVERRPALGVTAASVVGGLTLAWLMTDHLPPDPIRGQGARRIGFALAPLDGGGQLVAGGRW